MIFDTLDNLPKYFSLPDLSSLNDKPDGVYPFGDGASATIQTYQTKPFEMTRYETHRKFIDIQIVLDGLERIDVCPSGKLTFDGEYDTEKDVQFYNTPYTMEDCLSLTMCAGNFAVFYPEDAHRPQIQGGGPQETVKKIVIKVRG